MDKKTVRTLDIIPADKYVEELKNYKMYELKPDGSIVESPGVKKGDEVLFYDVSGAPREFKEEHADIIYELEVNDNKLTGNVTNGAVRIFDVVPESQYFSGLESYKMYSYPEDGILEESAGIKHINDNAPLLYDVTNAPDDFKREHADVIEQIEVREIIPYGKRREQKTGKM